ncbi:MAG: nucleotide exchange factor GrpE [Saprospiraceae bacterium]|nr:nucleotide exchange factor GrpE [Saprospiraceae bacterium]
MENNEVLQNEDVLQEEAVETPTESSNKGETEGLSKENADLKKQVDELKDKYLRQVAEFDNFRRRMTKEKVETIQMAARDTLTALLPILDDFDRAAKNESFTEGVNLVWQKFQNTLRSKGLVEMESPKGTDFDPDQHEAITEIPAGDDLVGKVVDTVEKGYLLNEKIIRYAKVVVGK